MIPTDYQNQIKAYAKSRPIELIYSFGSQATNKATPQSDYDFAVLFSKNLSSSKRFDQRLDFIIFVTKLLSTDKVDVVDAEKASIMFQYAIISPRKDIFVRNESIRIDFEKQVLDNYVDQIYYINRHTRNSLATIAERGL